jgi:serine/threonine protein kinase
VMDWVDGSNLKDVIREWGRSFKLAELLKILEPICSALNYAHLEGIIHCDIKPSNILLDTKGLVLLSDFGIARRASQQTTGGTPPYMAPEQFTGKTITARTDVYALGITCYELLSGGKVPFRGETSQTGRTTLRDRIYWEVMNLPYPPLKQFNASVPDNVEAVIRRAINRNPIQRQASALEFLNQFKSTVTELPMCGAYLIGLSGEWQGQSISITSEQFSIGRHSTCLLHLSDRGVSRNHATIIKSRDGFFLRNDNSTAGTFLNGNLVSASQLLKPGDVIQVGKWHRFEFRKG